MSLETDGPFIGFALLYALIATGVVLAGLHLFRRHSGGPVRLGPVRLSPVRLSPVRLGLAPVLLISFFFICLTQTPFPARGTLVCPLLRGVPQLVPFHYWATVQALWVAGSRWQDWVLNRMIAATVMNFVIPAAIGVALAPHKVSTRSAVGLTLALTFGAELTQLTGVWGVYPCAYRQFNVDDLMLNALGMLAGFILARRYVLTPGPVLTDGLRRGDRGASRRK